MSLSLWPNRVSIWLAYLCLGGASLCQADPRMPLQLEHQQQWQPALLLDSQMSMTVQGIFAEVTVTQVFTNPLAETLSGRYMFPLPATAAVEALTLRVGDREVVGQIQTKDEAQRQYQQAKASGQRAALLSQQRANYFSTQVANIPPLAPVEVSFMYRVPVGYVDGWFQLALPLVATPRYAPTSADALPGDEQVQRQGMEITVELVDVPAIGKVESPSHVLESRRQQNRIWLTGQDARESPSELRLRWQLLDSQQTVAALYREQTDDATYVAMLLAPGVEALHERQPKEWIMVLDTSGSMHGEAFHQAQQALLAALDQLGEADYFNVIAFSGQHRTLFARPQPARLFNLRQAQQFVQGLQAEGGTLMAPALLAALQGTSHLPRQVIFMTDGAIANESQLFQLIDQNIGEAHLYPVAIGPAPNRHFMTQAAVAGAGEVVFIQDVAQVQQQVGELFQRLQEPALWDIEVAWPQGSQVEMWPQRLPDVYAGRPVWLTAKLESAQGVVKVSGGQATGRWQQVLDLNPRQRQSVLPIALKGSGHRVWRQRLQGDVPGVAALWARQKIAGLRQQQWLGEDVQGIRDQITQVALQHHIVSPYTSLVAVDTEGYAAESAASDAVATAYPQTATAAPWQLLWGGVSLLLGLGLGWRQRCQG